MGLSYMYDSGNNTLFILREKFYFCLSCNLIGSAP
jgi:hypothetical protein